MQSKRVALVTGANQGIGPVVTQSRVPDRRDRLWI